MCDPNLARFSAIILLDCLLMGTLFRAMLHAFFVATKIKTSHVTKKYHVIVSKQITGLERIRTWDFSVAKPACVQCAVNVNMMIV